MHACKTIYAMVVLCWFPSVPQHTVLREKRVNMKYYYPEKMNMHQQEVGEEKKLNAYRAELDTGNVSSGFRFWASSWRWARNFRSASRKYVAVMWLYSLRSKALRELVTVRNDSTCMERSWELTLKCPLW